MKMQSKSETRPHSNACQWPLAKGNPRKSSNQKNPTADCALTGCPLDFQGTPMRRGPPRPSPNIPIFTHPRTLFQHQHTSVRITPFFFHSTIEPFWGKSGPLSRSIGVSFVNTNACGTRLKGLRWWKFVAPLFPVRVSSLLTVSRPTPASRDDHRYS